MHRFVKMSFPIGRSPRAWVIALLLICLLAAAAWSAGRTPPAGQGRADLIVIDRLKAFGPLERPPVVFAHDRHTAAAARQNKDCLACHQMDPQKKVLSTRFGHLGELDRQGLMDLFHERCIACHQELADQQQKAGPVTCGECHATEATTVSTRKPMGLDRSLHYRHVKANENKCERCHHEYDPAAKKLFYAKGREGACLYCHKAQSEENRISHRLASHQACINCHRDLALQKKEAGPLECSGCHDPQQQALISQASDIPRLERSQPDATLVKIVRTDAVGPPPQARMAAVAFDHKAHEQYAGQCRTCHHAAIAPCADCHTLQGHADGQMVKLAQAMHQPDAAMSCVGCHGRRQAEPECAGCHGAIAPERTWSSQVACKVCHLPPASAPPEPLTAEQAKGLAAELIATRRAPQPPLALEEIPETVTIGHLKDQYEAVTMPHRQIVVKLAAQVQEDRLAATFHGTPATLCQGCHHNSPAAAKPPQCGACHGRTSDALNLTRPGLMAAYHQQCLECHDRMGLAKPASRECTACHAKRAS